MKLLRMMILAIVCAFATSIPTPTIAITINEVLARDTVSAKSYEYSLGRARIGLIIDLATEDSWRSANLNFMIRSHPQAKESQIYLGLPSLAASNGINVSDIGGSSASRFNLIDWPQDSQIYFTGENNDRLSFTLSSTNPNYTVWDALSTSLSFEHCFLGCEFTNLYRLNLTYPGVTAYTVQLGEAAAVPVPASILLLAGGFIPFAWLRSRRKQIRRAPGALA